MKLTPIKFGKKLRVFVSSTSVDLGDWRKEISDILVGLGLEVIEMNYFPSMAESADFGSVAMVRKSDLFIGLYAHRYGTLAKDGKSITEHEFDAAQKNNIPCLCFFLKEEVDWDAKLIDNHENLKKLDEFKGKVKRKIIVSEFEDKDTLKIKVKQSVEEFLGTEFKRRRTIRNLVIIFFLLLVFSVLLSILEVGSKPYFQKLNAINSENLSEMFRLDLSPLSDTMAVKNYNGDLYLIIRNFGPKKVNLNGKVVGFRFSEKSNEIFIIIHNDSRNESGLIKYSVSSDSIIWSRFFQKHVFTCFNVSNCLITVGTEKGKIFRFDLNGRDVNAYNTPSNKIDSTDWEFGKVVSISYSDDGKKSLLTYGDGLLMVFDIENNKIVVSIDRDTDSKFISMFPSTAIFIGNETIAFAAHVEKSYALVRLYSLHLKTKSLKLITEQESEFSSLIPFNNDGLIM